jgi:alkaline phosphatase
MFNSVIDLVKSFVDQNPDTVMIAVADHETGGISDAVQIGPEYPIYNWNPHALINVKHSGEYIANRLVSMEQLHRHKFVTETVIAKWLNITESAADHEDVSVLTHSSSKGDIDKAVGRLVSRRAEIGWATHGHSGVDVNLYAYGRGATKLAGNHENTQIGDFISDSLGLDLAQVTERLNKAY